MAEKHVEQYLKKKVEAHGGLCYKFVSPSNRGVCDRIAISENGLTYYVELKFGKNDLSATQKVFRDKLAARGVPLYVIRSKEEVDLFIEKIFI